MSGNCGIFKIDHLVYDFANYFYVLMQMLLILFLLLHG